MVAGSPLPLGKACVKTPPESILDSFFIVLPSRQRGRLGRAMEGRRGGDKVTLVVGTFFLMTSLLSVLQQTGRIEFNVEVPILVFVSGFLPLLDRSPPVTAPKWVSHIVNPGPGE